MKLVKGILLLHLCAISRALFDSKTQVPLPDDDVNGAHMVRLSGGYPCAGRVELWRGGHWGSVCDNEFDLAEAEVVCRQVGCGYALSVSVFPPGRGPVLLDNLNCAGTEPNLWECPARKETHCGHKGDAGVVCSEMRTVRLSGGLDHCSGKVEIHRNGTWGTVCDNCWNRNIASITCSMLQCSPSLQNYTQFSPPLSHNPGPLYYYNCPLNMTGLWDCFEFVNNTNLCIESHAAGVICHGSLGFQVPTMANPSVKADTTEMVTEVTPVYRANSNSLPLTSLPLITLVSVSLLLLGFLTATLVLCCNYKSRLDSQRRKADRNPLSRPPSLDGFCGNDGYECVHTAVGACSSLNRANPPPIPQIPAASFDTSSTNEEHPYKEVYEELVYNLVSPEKGPSTGHDYDYMDVPGDPAKPGL